MTGIHLKDARTSKETISSLIVRPHRIVGITQQQLSQKPASALDIAVLLTQSLSSVFSCPIPISITSAFPALLLFPVYNLEGWGGVGVWREVEEGGDICISMADPC